MKNFVVKTAVKTLLIVLAVIVVGFVIFNFAFPQHMATFAEKLGNYDMAVWYSSLRYSYTDDTDDLARCLEDAILAENDQKIVEYGDEFFEKDDRVAVMVQLTEDKGIDYLNLFGGHLVSSKYACGDFDGALDLALDFFESTQSLGYECPLTSLVASLVSNKDAVNAPALLEALQSIDLSAIDLSEEDLELLDYLIADVSDLI